MDPGRLELLLRETLGLSAGRLDAWVTSLASKRLTDLRDTGAAGVHLGAYGWVEDLRPDSGLQAGRAAAGRAGGSGCGVHRQQGLHARAVAEPRDDRRAAAQRLPLA